MMKKINSTIFKDLRVLIRVDFNVPLDDSFNITDDTRIVSALPTIKKVIADGGKAVLLSHLGRPKNSFENRFSMKHIVPHLSNLLNSPVFFASDCVGESAVRSIKKMNSGDVLVLENLRFYPEESSGDLDFAKKLSELGDFYINDAFGVAHRNHASVSGITKYFDNKKCFGFLLELEVSNLKNILFSTKKPFTAIIGGGKISGKIDVIKSLLKKVDTLIIGGGMAYTFIKALGGSVGSSILEKDKIYLAKSLLEDAKKRGVNLLLPADSVNSATFSGERGVLLSKITEIPNGYMGLDIGEDAVSCFSKKILSSKTIVCNGPMGVFENPLFSNGTKKIMSAISEATKKGAFSLVGGGDSIAAAKAFGFENDISYISTGGGAMLEYLEGKELPGITSIVS